MDWKKILGGSLSVEELILTLLVANLGYSFYLKDSLTRIDSKLSEHISWHTGHETIKKEDSLENPKRGDNLSHII